MIHLMLNDLRYPAAVFSMLLKEFSSLYWRVEVYSEWILSISDATYFSFIASVAKSSFLDACWNAISSSQLPSFCPLSL